MEVGFIGLGVMGRPMASNLCRKGVRLMVSDLNPQAVRELTLLQARPAETVRELAARSDVIVTMLPDSSVVRKVVSGPDGAIAHARPKSIIMDMSTVSPETTDQLASEAKAKGIGFVDAPVGRLATHAARGESLFMVGGEQADVDRVRPLLEAMGTTVYHCGGVGAGTRTKLVNNYLAVASCQLNAEALALSQRFGLSLESTLNVLYNTSATNGQLKMNWPDKVLKGDVEPGFTIDLAHKDLTLIIEAANAVKVPMPIAAIARESFNTARSRGFGGKDFSAIVDANCELAGIEKPRLRG
ncbi:NAD-binding protein [Bradyrhizobium manausense]|uniref:NAD(P)-dependent oxidoreductase n=1 Tax=Bradyrhizobium manausense TaxID=989370 RepID=UPI001BA8C597|nr:NAD(P)-binding domain-containing protein [Bradyrhizobium manausense]MBR0834242.1 NAD-binding protein [Bradyrhizobium manausense]